MFTEIIKNHISDIIDSIQPREQAVVPKQQFTYLTKWENGLMKETPVYGIRWLRKGFQKLEEEICCKTLENIYVCVCKSVRIYVWMYVFLVDTVTSSANILPSYQIMKYEIRKEKKKRKTPAPAFANSP